MSLVALRTPSCATASGAIADPISSDTPCRRCGYNLRGLALAGQCPECGLPVDDSVRGTLLCYAPVSYQRRVCQGLTLLNVVALAGMLGGLFLQVLEGIWPYALLLLLGSVGCAGAWLLSTRDPRDSPSGTRRLRWQLRGGAAAGLGPPVIAIVIYVWDPPQPLRTALAAAALALTWAFLAGELAKYQYYAHVARALSKPRLARLAGWLRWPSVLTAACPALSFSVILLVAAAGPAPLRQANPVGAAVVWASQAASPTPRGGPPSPWGIAVVSFLSFDALALCATAPLSLLCGAFTLYLVYRLRGAVRATLRLHA